MDLICGLADKFCNLVIDLTWEQLCYLIYYHRNINQLNEQLEDLTLERRSVQHRIDEAENNVEQIEEKVHHWLSQVDALSEQAQKFHEEESQAKTECNITSCPNPWLRYKLSKRAKAMTEDVAKIFKKRIVGKISYRVPLPSVVESTNREGNEWIDSRAQIMNQILGELRNPGVNMIGLCGLGGVGKTTIAKEIEKNQKIFEKVIMVTVSQEMNIEKIQDRIIEKLDMKVNERTEEGKASRLYARLKNEENMLLILDDLWKELDLGKVGIPFVDVERDSKINEGCKILLTSRNEKLLSKNMKCQKIIRVDVLLEDEAWELFWSISELSIESSSSDLKYIANEIVQKCGRLPLAIATTAKALKYKDIDGWRDYLLRLKHLHPLARNVTGIREADNVLKLSYEDLSQENKDIFLLSTMLSHDSSVEELLMYSVGLDILKHTENMGDACNAIFEIVGKLKSLNLFLDSFSSHHFTMHDLYRDVALSIASEELNAVIVRHSRLDEWPDKIDLERCKRICLQECDICDLPEELNGPMLEFFWLNSENSDLTIPNMFFKSSTKLKVLAITNVHFLSLPSLSFLQRLKALCLHSCLLEDITEIRSLRKLKVLSLAYSKIQQLPVEVAELTSLQMLNLSYCSQLEVIPQKLLSNLKKLEVLYMGNSFKQWKVEESSKAVENASLDELMDLPISSLEIHIPDLSMMPENLFLKMNLRRYKIFIGERWTWYSNYGASKILKLELESGIDLTARLRNLSKGVEDLHLYGSNGQENVLYNLDASGFPCLRYLQIESNDDIKYIILNSAHHEDAFPIIESLELKNLKALENLCEGPNDVVFGQLHTLKMDNLPALTGDFSIKDRTTKNASNKIFKSLFNKVLLPKLEILELSNLNSLIPLIWDDQLLHNSFNNLKILTVRSCGFVKLVPIQVLKSLNKLEELDVEDCDMLEIVFEFEDLNDYYKEMESSSMVVPLEELKLSNLPELKNVWSNNYQGNVSFPSLRSIYVDYCVSLTSIFPTSTAKVLLPNLEILELSNLNSLIPLIWDDQLLHNSFNNLKTLMVEKCGFLKLVPHHVLKSLNNLEELYMEDCDMLEIVFDFEDLNDYYKEMESSSVVVPLKELKLRNLPKLKNVWSNNYQGNVSFPSLKSVYVDDCVSLTSIFPTKMLLQRLEILELSNLNSLIHLIWDDQLLHNSFNNLKTLTVRSCGFVKLVPLHVLKSLNNLEELEVVECDMLEFVFDFDDLNDYYKEMESSSVVVPVKKLELRYLPELKNVWSNNCQGNVSFPSLRSGDVYECESLTSIFPTSAVEALLPKLEILELSNLNSLIHLIWDDQLLHNSFKNLKTLTVRSCGFVKLVPLHMLKSLYNLEELEVVGCDMLEFVFDFDDLNDYYKEMESSSVVVPVKKLELRYLPELKNVWSNNCQGNVSFPSLRSGDVYECESLTSIFPTSAVEVLLPKLEILELSNLNSLIHLIWDDQLLHNSFKNLKTLTVRSCGFVKLVPLHMLKSLNNLEDLEVVDCDMLEFVFDFEDLNDYYKEMESSSVVVPVKKLRLRNLPNLKNVWSNNCQGNISFPSLKSIYVSECESLTSIFPASIAQGMLCDLEELQIRQCGVDMIVAKDQVSESVAVTFGFPRLTSLVLSDLPNLRNFYPLKHTLEWRHLNKLSIQCCDELEIFEKEVSSSSKIYEEENMLHSKYPLLPHDKVIENLEMLRLQGKEVEKIGSGQFLMDHFPKLKQLHLSLEKEPLYPVWKRSPNLGKLKLSGDFEKALGSNNVIALAGRFPKLTLENNSILGSLSPSLVSLPNLTHLNMKKFDGTTLMTSSIAQSLVHITHLSISRCSQIEEIITKQEGEHDQDKEISFKKLEYLKLTSLRSLRRFCRHNYTFTFPLLTKLVIHGCPKFKRFSPGLINTPSLKSVQLSRDWRDRREIWDTNLNKTFYHQRFMGSREVVLDEDDAIMIRNDQFPLDVPTDCCRQAEILRIKRFVEEWATFPYTLLERFPKLNELHVKNSSFREIFPSHAPFSTSFHNLTILKVSKCHQLVYLVTCSTAKSLVNLETLEIDDCEKMEEIIKKEPKEDVEEAITLFSGLRILKLGRVPKLKTQEDKKDFNIEDRATNTGCTNISRSLFSHKVLLPKLERLELSYLLNNLISLIWDDQFLHNSFSNLKTLIVQNCDFMKLVPLQMLKSLNNLEKLEVSYCQKLEMVFGFEDLNDHHKEMESSTVVVPLSLRHLEVNGCRGLTTLMASSAAPSLAHLAHLSINGCREIEEVIMKQEGEDDEDKEIIFNMMKFLEFDNLPRLKRFCGYNYTFKFPLLEHVTITECPRLTMFCPGAIHVPQLQSVQVDKYEPDTHIWMKDLNNTIQHLFTFEEVISTTQSLVINGKNITRIVDVFPNVSSLYVESFTDEGVTFPHSSLGKFPELDELHVEHCSFEEIFPSQYQIIDFMGKISSSASFQNLWRLSVSGCHKLIHLVTTSTAKNLVSLRLLEINDCKRMEEIVMNDTNEDVESGVTFNQLRKIKLTDMPSLKMFSLESHTFECPELEKIKISACPEMKKFCPGVLKTPKLSKVKIEEHGMEWKDELDLNKTMEGLSSTKDSINI